MKAHYKRQHCILTAICTITTICGFALFLLYVLLLSVDQRFIAYNQFSNTGQYPAILFYISISFCILYAFLLVISLFAIWAIMKQSTYILKLYAAFLCLTVLLQYGAAILCIVYMKTMPRKLRDYMADNLRSNYTGSYYDRQFDRSVDWTQINYECCGVNSYRDYQNGYYFNTHNQYTIVNLIPSSCCIYRNQINLLNQCQSNLINSFRRGCYDILMIWLDQYGSLIASITFIVAFIHSVCFIFLIRGIRFLNKLILREIKSQSIINNESIVSGNTNTNTYSKNMLRQHQQQQRNMYMTKFDTSTLDETLSNLESRT